MSDYFDSSTNRVPSGSLAKSEQVNNLRDDAGNGFDMLPPPDVINQGRVTFAEDVGTANHYALTLASTVLSYETYLTVSFIPTHANTGASTLNVNGLGVIAIRDNDGDDLSPGALSITSITTCTYNGTHFVLAGVTSATLEAIQDATELARDETYAARDITVAKEALVNPHYDAIDGVYANETNINAVNANSTNINTVAGIDTSVTTVAGISANVTTVAGNTTNINTVAGNDSDITTVANNDADVSTVATDIADVSTVADDLNEGVSEINTVAVSIADVNTVGTNISSVNTTATNIDNVNIVASDLSEPLSEINTVATSITNVDAVGTNITNVNTVATSVTNVNTVATNISDVSDVGTNISDVTDVADNMVAVQGASANATAAAASAALSEDYAITAEDTQVESGTYSSLHWAAKAEGFRDDAQAIVDADHNSFTGIQGGSSTERYHLTNAQHTIVGNTSNTNTGDQTTITGNAGTATALQTARTIGGTSFNGTANITPANATLAASATKLATARSITLSGDVTGTATYNGTATTTISTTVGNDSHTHSLSTLPQASTTQRGIVEVATTAEVEAGTDTTRAATCAGVKGAIDNKTTITGNAGTATALQTARTIGITGDITATAVSFNGTANIAISASVNDDSHFHTSATLPTTPNATTSVRGIVELATTAEAAAGIDTTRAVTAAGLAAFNVIPAHGAVGAILIAWHAAGTYDFGDTIAGSSLIQLIESDERGGLGFRRLPDDGSAGLSMNGTFSGWVSCGVSGTWSARSTSSAATDRHSPNIWIRIA